jgi:hypothetical protein
MLKMKDGKCYVVCDVCNKEGKISEDKYLKLLFGTEKKIYCPVCFKKMRKAI